MLPFPVAIFHKANSISIYACAVPFTMIRREHPGSEELIGSVVLWEDITKYVGQPLTSLTVTALAATEGQFIDFILSKKHVVGYIERMQVSGNVSIHPVTDTILRISWCDE